MAFGLAFVYRRFSSDRGKLHLRLVEAPHKISAGKEDPEAVADPGKTMVTIFFGTQTGTAEGFGKGNERSLWFQQLTYGVFGLGNRQYEHFNKISKVVDEVLNEQGKMWVIDGGMLLLVVVASHIILNFFTLLAWEDEYANVANGNAAFDIHHLRSANVAVQRELHKPDSDRCCIHLEFDITGTGLMEV